MRNNEMAADARAGRCLRRRECRVYTQSISRREPLAGLKALKGIPLVGQHSPKGSGPSFQPHPFFSPLHATCLSAVLSASVKKRTLDTRYSTLCTYPRAAQL